jgi:hypothetical protein
MALEVMKDGKDMVKADQGFDACTTCWKVQ